jgi:hypothetical protein
VHKMTMANSVLVLPLLVLLVVIPTTTATTATYGQPSVTSELDSLPALPATIAPDETFQSTKDGFKLKVPADWGVTDIDNTIPEAQDAEKSLGYTYLAVICSEYTPGLGGTSECQITPTSNTVMIMRIGELDQRPEVQNLILSQNKTLSLQDLLVLYTDVLESFGTYGNLKTVATTPTQVNVSSTANSATSVKSTVPGLIIEWSYEVEIDNFPSTPVEAKMFSLLVLSPDKNTGYAIYTPGVPPKDMPTIPQPVQQIFDSFELIVPS